MDGLAAAGEHDAAHDLVGLGQGGGLPSLSQKVVRNVSRLRAYRVLDATGMRAGQLTQPSTFTPWSVTVISPGLVAAQLPPASAARSTTTLPGRMASTMGWVRMTGALRPITSAVQITRSFLATVAAISSACFWRKASVISLA